MSNSENHTAGLRPMFERFQRRGHPADASALADMYAATLMVASPGGTQVITSADLLRAVPKREALFDAAGHQSTTLAAFDEQTLTPRYTLVRAEWEWLFKRPSGQSVTVTLPSTYIVDRLAETPRIVVYIIQEDIGAVLRQRGLLPTA
jgi:hypothetical protein